MHSLLLDPQFCRAGHAELPTESVIHANRAWHGCGSMELQEVQDIARLRSRKLLDPLGAVHFRRNPRIRRDVEGDRWKGCGGCGRDSRSVPKEEWNHLELTWAASTSKPSHAREPEPLSAPGARGFLRHRNKDHGTAFDPACTDTHDRAAGDYCACFQSIQRSRNHRRMQSPGSARRRLPPRGQGQPRPRCETSECSRNLSLKKPTKTERLFQTTRFLYGPQEKKPNDFRKTCGVLVGKSDKLAASSYPETF
jgi:hypothetical protein